MEKFLAEYAFTVFTPTYDRAHTLHRVYQSLRAQTFRDFEWLVVDDGSTDRTAELVEQWRHEASFPIRYLWQQNRGKHVAFNRAVGEARGEFFLTLDSDDACVPDALERLRHHWDSIPEDRRDGFSAVTALCVDQAGRLVGDRFPRDVMDSDSLEIFYRYRVGGEKWGFHRTEVLRRFAFPELRGVQYVPEGVVWSRIARHYRTRFVNEALRIYYVDAPSLVNGVAPGAHARSGRFSSLAQLNEEIDHASLHPVHFLRAAALYVRFSCHAGVGPIRQHGDVSTWAGRALWALSLPVGGLYFLMDRLRARAEA